MSTVKIAGIALLAVGVLGVAYGGFGDTWEMRQARMGAQMMSHHERVNVPVWTGVAAIVVGGLLLIVPKHAA